MGAPSVAPVAPSTPSSAAKGSPYLTTPRGPASREELDIHWIHPVHAAPVLADDGATHALPARAALPLEAAIAELAGKDRRPLLVLRECLYCNGTDDALLTREADNERTMLLSRWFHCVKLPPSVLDADDPYHALFPGDAPPHLFVALADGTQRIDLKGDQSRTELWAAMDATLARAYGKKPDKALSTLGKILDRLDQNDAAIQLAQRRLEDEIEDSGPASRKAKKLAAEVEKLRGERAELHEEAAKLSTWKPRVPAPPVPGGDDAAG